MPEGEALLNEGEVQTFAITKQNGSVVPVDLRINRKGNEIKLLNNENDNEIRKFLNRHSDTSGSELPKNNIATFTKEKFRDFMDYFLEDLKKRKTGKLINSNLEEFKANDNEIEVNKNWNKGGVKIINFKGKKIFLIRESNNQFKINNFDEDPEVCQELAEEYGAKIKKYKLDDSGRPIVFEFDDNNNSNINRFMEDFKEDDTSIKRGYSADGVESPYTIQNRFKILNFRKWQNSGWRIVGWTLVYAGILAAIVSALVWVPMLSPTKDNKSSNKKKDNKKKSKKT